mgnify:CR=1 FL=1
MGYISDDTRKVTTHRLIEMKQRGEKNINVDIIRLYYGADCGRCRGRRDSGGRFRFQCNGRQCHHASHHARQMIYHGKSVVRGVKRAMVIVDMPFGSYQGNELEGLASAIRIMKESHADALKLEGGEEIIGTVKRILSAGIPIMDISD